MVAPTTALFLGMSATLVVSAVLQLYPTYKYAQNVLYPRGVKLLSASLLALVVGWLTNDLVSYGVVDAAVLRTVAQASFTTASTLFLWANLGIRERLRPTDRGVGVRYPGRRSHRRLRRCGYRRRGRRCLRPDDGSGFRRRPRRDQRRDNRTRGGVR
jgi:hypothetical protein